VKAKAKKTPRATVDPPKKRGRPRKIQLAAPPPKKTRKTRKKRKPKKVATKVSPFFEAMGNMILHPSKDRGDKSYQEWLADFEKTKESAKFNGGVVPEVDVKLAIEVIERFQSLVNENLKEEGMSIHIYPWVIYLGPTPRGVLFKPFNDGVQVKILCHEKNLPVFADKKEKEIQTKNKLNTIIKKRIPGGVL